MEEFSSETNEMTEQSTSCSYGNPSGDNSEPIDGETHLIELLHTARDTKDNTHHQWSRCRICPKEGWHEEVLAHIRVAHEEHLNRILGENTNHEFLEYSISINEINLDAPLQADLPNEEAITDAEDIRHSEKTSTGQSTCEPSEEAEPSNLNLSENGSHQIPITNTRVTNEADLLETLNSFIATGNRVRQTARCKICQKTGRKDYMKTHVRTVHAQFFITPTQESSRHSISENPRPVVDTNAQQYTTEEISDQELGVEVQLNLEEGKNYGLPIEQLMINAEENYLRQEMKERNENVHDLVIYFSTRWNSTYEMFLSVIKTK